jgi:hypothetical protein
MAQDRAEAEPTLRRQRNFHRLVGAPGRHMGNGDNDHNGLLVSLARREDDSTRTVLASLFPAVLELGVPEVGIADNQTGFRDRKGHLSVYSTSRSR